jgi:hypothetical protein
MNNPLPGHLWIIFTVVYRLGILSALFFIAYFLWSTKPSPTANLDQIPRTGRQT